MKKVKAFILAAGVGTRLRPLTYYMPKPMFPIVDKPVMEHTLDLLKRSGIEEMIVNLHYHPQVIRNYFGNGSKLGLQIHYSEEKDLLGTAGGVRKCSSFFDTTFLIMSGDGLTDLNLQNVLDFHWKNKSIATMVLKPIDTRFEYGVTVVDKYGKIKKFVEKPSWGEVFSNTVNTGIYIFEPEIMNYIPPDTFYDFGKDLWPLLLRRKERIFGYVMDEYWCDIGNLNEYRRAQRDVLEQKVKVNVPGQEIRKHVWIGKNTKIDPSAKLFPPCVIGENCTIEKDVIIDHFTVIGNKCWIKQEAKIGNTILWDEVVVEKTVGLSNCIIGNRANVSENISVFEGSVINIKE